MALNQSQINCTVAALSFTRYDTSSLSYCNETEQALDLNGLIYKLAQKTQTKQLCGSLCNRTIYQSTLNYLSSNVLSKELKVYGNDWYIIWAFYSSLYVQEKIETYVYEFDSILVAVGGSMGLFLGISCHTIIVAVLSLIFRMFHEKK